MFSYKCSWLEIATCVTYGWVFFSNKNVEVFRFWTLALSTVRSKVHRSYEAILDNSSPWNLRLNTFRNTDSVFVVCNQVLIAGLVLGPNGQFYIQAILCFQFFVSDIANSGEKSCWIMFTRATKKIFGNTRTCKKRNSTISGNLAIASVTKVWQYVTWMRLYWE